MPIEPTPNPTAPPPDAPSPPDAPPEKVYALLAEFTDVDQVMAAAQQVRDAGYRTWDVHSPFPIHGVPRAMGLRPTILPWIALVHGLIGIGAGLLLVWWTNAHTVPGLPAPWQGYEYLISGKPRFSLPANIPILFELGVLLAAVGTLLGMLGLNKLPMLANPLLKSERFRRATSDRFFVVIEARDPKFALSETRNFLESLGATAIEVVTYRPSRAAPAAGYESERWPFPSPGRLARELRLPRPPLWLVAAVLAVPLAGLGVLGWILHERGTPFRQPRLHVIQDMGLQPRYGPQSPDDAFADGRAMRPPVTGTVARGALEDEAHYHHGYEMRPDPAGGPATLHYFDGLPAQVRADPQLLDRGRQLFGIYCAACHGAGGDGHGPVNEIALLRREPKWVAAPSLLSAEVRAKADGYVYNAIRQGVRGMPPYGSQIDPADRWAVTAWVRQLQKESPVPATQPAAAASMQGTPP